MRISAFFWCWFLSGITLAQSDSLQSKIKYYNSFVSGVLIGSAEDADEKEFSLSFTSIHGIKFKSGLKLGLGVGLDTYYDLKVVPFITSVSFDQERKRNGLFIQLNSGYSIVRYTKNNEEFGDLYEKGGFTMNPMIGYRIKVEDFRIYWQAGYKYQVAEVGYEYLDWGGNTQRDSRNYEFNRFVIQLGFGFR
jgi:hypothetical protein